LAKQQKFIPLVGFNPLPFFNHSFKIHLRLDVYSIYQPVQRSLD